MNNVYRDYNTVTSRPTHPNYNLNETDNLDAEFTYRNHPERSGAPGRHPERSGRRATPLRMPLGVTGRLPVSLKHPAQSIAADRGQGGEFFGALPNEGGKRVQVGLGERRFFAVAKLKST